MRRMATLDFVRGLCIMGMVSLHIFGRVYDSSWLGGDGMSERSLLHVVVLVSLAYMGGMAGLFLMVSSISHTISIRERLRKGVALEKVIAGQLIGGFALLALAFLVESAIGHHGFLGRLAYYDPSSGIGLMDTVRLHSPRLLYRGFHFMTLHTIAWCAIINSVIQYFLYRGEGHERTRRNTSVYIVLIISVIALTPLVWGFASWVIPGYPFAVHPGSELAVQYPMPGRTDAVTLLKLFILSPLAGQTEPLFPFMFISFIGAVIGIHLSEEKPHMYLPHKGMKIGGVMFAAGVLGIAFMWITGLDSIHNLIENTYLVMRLRIWLPVLLLTTGGQLVFLMMTIRLVEYRGVAGSFADGTKLFRRFAAASLTIYTFQYLDAVPLNLISLFPGVNVISGKEGMFWSFAAVMSALFTWHLLLLLWERYHFIGSLEWCLGRIKGSKKRTERTEWMSVVPKEVTGLDRFRDSILSLYLAGIGFFIFPVTILARSVARRAILTEGKNRYNSLSIRLSGYAYAWGSFAIFTLSQARAYVPILP